MEEKLLDQVLWIDEKEKKLLGKKGDRTSFTYDKGEGLKKGASALGMLGTPGKDKVSRLNEAVGAESGQEFCQRSNVVQGKGRRQVAQRRGAGVGIREGQGREQDWAEQKEWRGHP